MLTSYFLHEGRDPLAETHLYCVSDVCIVGEANETVEERSEEVSAWGKRK